MIYVSIVSSLILLQVFYFAAMVGKARGKYGVNGPAVTGHELAQFERRSGVAEAEVVGELLRCRGRIVVCHRLFVPRAGEGIGRQHSRNQVCEVISHENTNVVIEGRVVFQVPRATREGVPVHTSSGLHPG